MQKKNSFASTQCTANSLCTANMKTMPTFIIHACCVHITHNTQHIPQSMPHCMYLDVIHAERLNDYTFCYESEGFGFVWKKKKKTTAKKNQTKVFAAMHNFKWYLSNKFVWPMNTVRIQNFNELESVECGFWFCVWVCVCESYLQNAIAQLFSTHFKKWHYDTSTTYFKALTSSHKHISK